MILTFKMYIGKYELTFHQKSLFPFILLKYKLIYFKLAHK